MPTLSRIEKNLFEDLYTTNLGRAEEQERFYEIAKYRKADLYWNATQNLIPVRSPINGSVVDWMTWDDYSFRNREAENGGPDYAMNMYRSKGRKFIAVLGTIPPSLKCIPLDDSDIAAVRMARVVDAISQRLDRVGNRAKDHPELCAYLYKYGTSWIYTPTVTDRERFGFYKVPMLEMVEQQVIGDDGVESTETVLRYMGDEEVENLGVDWIAVPPTQVMCPYNIRDFRKAPWFRYEFEEYAANIIANHPEWEVDIRNISATDGPIAPSNTEGQILRSQIGNPSHLPYTQLLDQITVRIVWFHPGVLRMLPKVEAGRGDLDRDEVMRRYPRGVRVTYLNGTAVEAVPEYYGDVWTPVKPETSDTLFCDGIGYDFLTIQDLINDNTNVMAEIYERTAGTTFADPSVVDLRALSQQRPSPGTIFPTLRSAGGSARDAIHHINGPGVDPGLPNFVSSVDKGGSDIIGITDQLSGAGEGARTAKEYELRQQAAMRQISTTWKNIREAEAEAQKKMLLNDARNREEPYEVGGEFIDPAEVVEFLTNRLTIQAEEAIPKTFGERRDLVREMLDRGPEAWEFFNMGDVENAIQLSEYLSIPGWTWRNVAEYYKVQGIIEALLMAEPVTDPMSGQPLPSEQPDPSEDDMGFVVTVIRHWTAKPQGISAKRANPAGYANVKAYMQACEMIQQQQMMAEQQQMMMAQGGPPPQDAGGPMPASPTAPFEPAPPPGMGGELAPPGAESGIPMDGLSPDMLSLDAGLASQLVR